MNFVKKYGLFVLIFMLSILNIFVKINYIYIILLLIFNLIFQLYCFYKRKVPNASLIWYIKTKENLMLICGIALTILDYYQILSLNCLWLIINIIIMICSLIYDEKTMNRIY